MTARSFNSTAAPLNADEIRRIVARGKQTGALRLPGDATPVEKNGQPVAAMAGLRSQWIDVTPATAKQWLENNFRNRPISDDVITAYARDITNGTWVPTHQGIAFNDRDELIDGQHRLHAVIRANKTVRMMVTFGLPSKIEGSEMTTMDAVDRGRTRSVADQLKIQHGMKNGTIIAALAMAIGRLCYGHRTRRLSVGQTLEIYRAFQTAVDFVVEHRSTDLTVRSAGVLAGFAFALTAAPGMPIEKYYLDLQVCTVAGKNAPLAHLLTFLGSDEAKLLTRQTDVGMAELTCEAIRLQLLGKSIPKLELASTGVKHFAALQPERVAKIAAIFTLPEGDK